MNASNDNVVSENWKAVLMPFALSRVLILAVLIIASSAVFTEHRDSSLVRSEARASHLVEGISKIEDTVIVADAGWYRGIAENGYSQNADFGDEQRNWAFFPLFPIIWKLGASLTGEYAWAGIILGNTFFLLALIAIYQLLLASNFSAKTCKLTAWLLCFFPTSYFFSLPLTESLFLMLIAWSALLIKRGRPGTASVILAVATGARPTGLLMIPAFFLYLIEHSYKPAKAFALSTLIAPLGLVSYSAYLYSITKKPLAWLEIQRTWRPGGFPDIDFSNPVFFTDWNFVALNIASAAISLLAGCYFLTRRQFAAACLVSVPILSSLWTGSTLSLSRHLLTLFPVFLFIALAAQRTGLERALLTLFSFGLAFLTLLFSLKVTFAMA